TGAMMSLSEKPICFPDPNAFDLTDSDITEWRREGGRRDDSFSAKGRALSDRPKFDLPYMIVRARLHVDNQSNTNTIPLKPKLSQLNHLTKMIFRFLTKTAAGHAWSDAGRRSSLLGHAANFTKSDFAGRSTPPGLGAQSKSCLQQFAMTHDRRSIFGEIRRAPDGNHWQGNRNVGRSWCPLCRRGLPRACLKPRRQWLPSERGWHN